MEYANFKLEIPNTCMCGKDCSCKKCRSGHFDLKISNYVKGDLDEK
ncbi:MAG: hypothetical protein AABX25_02600 [Nanoarchaeota archaeon]